MPSTRKKPEIVDEHVHVEGDPPCPGCGWASAQPAPALVPDVIEGPGRYRVYAAPDGGWVIARAGPLCERCAECGCGEQGDPITIPALVIQVARQRMNGDGGPGLMAMLKAVTGRG